MGEPVNHHYLPVFYLRQWCNSEGKVVRYYRPHKDVVHSSITPERTGYEPHLYSLEGYPPDQRQWVEKNYMGPVVDEPASRALRILLARNTPELTAETRIDWTRFLMSLLLRDPATVAKTNADAREGLVAKLLQNPKEYEDAKSEDDPPTFVEWVESNVPHLLENVGRIWLPDFIENEEVGTVLIRMRWSVFDFERSGITLLTGDRPFIRSHGLKDQKCVVVLPLSPRFAFIAVHAPETYRGLLNAGTKRLASDINGRIVTQTDKHVYGKSKSHLRFIEKRWLPSVTN
jgi:hypothetical protein